MRRALRTLADILMVAGLLVIADVAITLVWQEPISALYAAFSQRELSHQLAQAQGRFGSDGRGIGSAALRMRRRVRPGDPIGRIAIARMKINFVMVEGTDAASLSKGPGHYRDTSWPGLPGTVAIAGHRTTYLAPFQKLNLMRRRDLIILEMPYGRFVYRATLRRIVSPQAYRYVTRAVGYERLALTACHPLYSARQRVVVFARLAAVQAWPTVWRQITGWL